MTAENNDLPNFKLWRTLGIVGLIGAILVGVGEFMVHYSPDGLGGERFSLFADVSEQSLVWGHFLMVGSLPLYVFGYLHLYLGFRPGGRGLAAAIFVLGVFSFMVGGVWVGSRAYIGSLQHLLDTPETKEIWLEVSNRYQFYLENLVQALRVFILLLSVCFFIIVIKGKTIYPKWYAFAAPIIPLIIIFVSFATVPQIGKYLLPAAMNVAHTIVFLFSLIGGRKALRS